jgi:hypothetical protein
MGEVKNILAQLRSFFGYLTLSYFADDYRKQSDEDKKQLRHGIEDGSFNY